MQRKGVIVDTSVWIEFFNEPNSPAKREVVKLLQAGRVCICGMELAEILQGTRSERERKDIEDAMSRLPFLRSDLSTWMEMGMIASLLMKKGITIPLTDLFIGATALANGCSVFAIDQHFEMIPGLSLHQHEQGEEG